MIPSHRAAHLLLLGTGLFLCSCVGNGAPTEWSSKQRSAGGAATPGAEGLAPVPAAPLVSLTSGPATRAAALELLRQAVDSPSPLLRANAIEALGSDPDASRPALRKGLVDSNRGVRFVSAMSVGNARALDLVPLVEPLLRDEHQSVQAAAIFALHRCGRAADQTPLASMILSDDPEVRGNAALVIGEIGNSSALPVLQNSLGRGLKLVNPARVRVVEMQIAEAQLKLGDDRAADPVRAALFVPPEQAEIAALACQICGRAGDERSITALRRLVEASGSDTRPSEVRLAAITALGRLGAGGPELVAAAAALTDDPRPDIRAQAAVALGRLGQAGSDDPAMLGPAASLLSDRNPMVQVAAAEAVLRLTGPRSD